MLTHILGTVGFGNTDGEADFKPDFSMANKSIQIQIQNSNVDTLKHNHLHQHC